MQKESYFEAAAYFRAVRAKALIWGKREGSCLTSALGEGTERPLHSAPPASLPPTPSRDSRGPGEMGRREAHPETPQYPPQIAATAGRAPTALGTRSAAPAPHPLGLRARRVRGCAWPPAPTRTGHERHRGRDKGSRPHAHAGAGSEGGKALGTRGGPGPEALGVRWRAGRGITCAVVVVPGGWRVGTVGSVLRPASAHLWGWVRGRR